MEWKLNNYNIAKAMKEQRHMELKKLARFHREMMRDYEEEAAEIWKELQNLKKQEENAQ